MALFEESTPLLQVVAIAPPKKRYPHQTLRRICSGLLTTVCIVGIVIIIIFLLVPDSGSSWSWRDSFHLPSAWPDTKGIAFERLQKILLATPDEKRIRETSKYYTAGPHLAGKNLSQAVWTRDQWEAFGIKSTIVAYDVYINYPLDHRLALIETGLDGDSKVKFEASLEEDVLKEDRTSGLKDRVPTFHGYSANGNVTASYVFCNYGSFQDFEDLQKAEVPLEGKIAIIRYAKVFRGLKVKRAQELGMVGVVIYSDPGDDGVTTEENGYKAYPDGPARHPSSVQRGSVEFISYGVGDPTTPGYPSKPGVPRQPYDHQLPRIPSLPISYREAIPILMTLNGHGPKASSLGEDWKTVGLGYKGVKYNIGPSPPSLKLNLYNKQDYTITPLWDVIGIINGTTPDEVIVTGNHRDAWVAGGAADPNSGSASLNEVVRGLGLALKAGWKPKRTIVLGSWDGEEYGLVGSTEWVEEFITWLSDTAVAYVNVDMSASGPYFKASAAPLLDKVIIDNTKLVQSPNSTFKRSTVWENWDKTIDTIGSGSDFTAFQDFAGIPCIDMAFKDGEDTPVYHYHSNYDSFDWMENFGDPGWHYHATMSKLWGVMLADLAETAIIPFSATNYAAFFRYFEKELVKHIAESPVANQTISIEKLSKGIESIHKASIVLDAEAASLRVELKGYKDLPWYRFWKRIQIFRKVRTINQRYKMIERKFLYANGLDKRSWFKHSVFAPGRWTGYSGVVWPGLVESIDDGDVGNFYRWESIISSQMHDVVKLLKG